MPVRIYDKKSSVELTSSHDLLLRSSPDSMFTIFFLLLSALHGGIAASAFYQGRWEGYLSAVFCLVFGGIAALFRNFQSDITLLNATRELRIRRGMGPFQSERRLAFSTITGVRLTLLGKEGTTIDLLCPHEDIRCPFADHPRQEALLLAMTLDTPLIKVYGDDIPEESEPRDSLVY